MQEVANILPLFVALSLIAFGAGMALTEGKRGASAKTWTDFDAGER